MSDKSSAAARDNRAARRDMLHGLPLLARYLAVRRRIDRLLRHQ